MQRVQIALALFNYQYFKSDYENVRIQLFHKMTLYRIKIVYTIFVDGK